MNRRHSGTTRVRTRPSTFAALLAVYALCLHAFLAGLAGGALAAPLGLDAFGGVLCSTTADEGAPSLPGQPAHRGHVPECCLAGCPAVGGHAVLTAPVALTAFAPAGAFATTWSRTAAVARPSARTPLNPRAPPLA